LHTVKVFYFIFSASGLNWHDYLNRSKLYISRYLCMDGFVSTFEGRISKASSRQPTWSVQNFLNLDFRSWMLCWCVGFGKDPAIRISGEAPSIM